MDELKKLGRVPFRAMRSEAPGPYLASKETFSTYLERFENYFDESNMPAGKKVEVFLSCIGDEVYQILKDCAVPFIPKNLPFPEISRLLLSHYFLITPKTNNRRRSVTPLPSLQPSTIERVNFDIVKSLVTDVCNSGCTCAQSHNQTVDGNITPLHIAAQCGKLEVIKLLVKRGANVNAKSRERITPLHLAIQHGQFEIVEVLLEAKANVNAKDIRLVTPLHIAVECNDFKSVKALIDKNADVDAKTYDNATPLHIGSQRGYYLVVELLLKSKANVNARKNNDLTPLHLAIPQKHYELSDLLIKFGADVNAATDMQWTPLLIAAGSESSLQLVEILIKRGANLNAKTDDGRRPLHWAAANKNLEVVDCLIANGADVNAVDNKKWTPLHVAAQTGCEKVALSLINKVNNINCKTAQKVTPLNLAVSCGHIELVRLLLSKGADANSQNANWTPLHYAAEKGHNEIVTFLLQNGADVNAKEHKICTALHLAVQRGHLNVVKTLIMNGANVNAHRDNCVTPLYLAAQNGNLPIVKILLNSGAYFDAKTMVQTTKKLPHMDAVEFLKLHNKFLKAVIINDCAGVKLGLARGAIIDICMPNAIRPIHIAVIKENFEMVQLLVNHGASVTKVTEDGASPLYMAASKGNKEIVDFLLRHVNRDFINVTNFEGNSPLHISSLHGFYDVLKSLLNYGAIYNKKGIGGITPLDMTEDDRIVNLLKILDNMFEKAKNGNLEVINKLKKLTPDEFTAVTNARNDQGKSLLQVAIINKHKHIASQLLEVLKKTDQNKEEPSGVTNGVKNLKI